MFLFIYQVLILMDTVKTPQNCPLKRRCWCTYPLMTLSTYLVILLPFTLWYFYLSNTAGSSCTHKEIPQVETSASAGEKTCQYIGYGFLPTAVEEEKEGGSIKHASNMHSYPLHSFSWSQCIMAY